MNVKHPDLIAAGGIVFLMLVAGLAPAWSAERDTVSQVPQPTMSLLP
jgi:hypothetical protein